jgi:hypothetical protein
MFYDWNVFSRSIITGILTYSTIHYILSKLISRKDERQHWRHVNISTSFIHSILASIATVYLLVNNWKKEKNIFFSLIQFYRKSGNVYNGCDFIIYAKSLFIYFIWTWFVLCSNVFPLENRIHHLGYFIFDSIDNLRHFSGRQTYEILLHHITVQSSL